MTQPVFETTATALREKSKLRRHFRRFDMFFYLICTVVTIDTIGAVASNGAQGFTWLIFLGVFFFLPYGLSVAELGSAFPQEGGPYVWSRLAFGRPLAAINSVIYWISKAAADELDPGDFFYPAVVLDVRTEAKEDADFTLGVVQIRSRGCLGASGSMR